MNQSKELRKRMTYFNEDEKLSPLIYLFSISIMTWIIAIAFFSSTGVVEATALFRALEAMSPVIRMVWGWVGVGLVVVNSASFFFGSTRLNKIIAYVGLLMWLYAAAALLISGIWIHFFAIAVPNALYSVWLYFETIRYEKEGFASHKGHPSTS